MIDFLALRRFIIVCEEMSFSRAAKRLGISQPAVTFQINMLEGELGLDLFIREQQRILALTEAGKSYLRHARAIVSGLDETLRSARSAIETGRASVRIGVTEEAASLGFVRLYEWCKGHLDDISVEIREFQPDDITEAVSTEEVDIGFAIHPPSGAIAAEQVWHEHWCVVLPTDHPLAGRESFTLEDVAGLDLILAHPRDGGAHELLRQLMAQANLYPRLVRQASRRSTILALAAAGAGTTILQYSRHVRVSIDGAIVRPLAAPPPWITMLSRPNSADAVARVAALARKIGADLLLS